MTDMKHSRIWQNSPSKPSRQKQENEKVSIAGTQTPSFRHGDEVHGFNAAKIKL